MNNNVNKIKNIVIVGGGTAGWLSAAYLSKALNTNHNDECHITLIESSDIPTLGVGEATIPSLVNTLRFLEIPESDWMPKCNATYKLAIKFVDWFDQSSQDIYWHPFGNRYSDNNIPLSHYWFMEKNQGSNLNFAESFEEVHLSKAKKSPKEKLFSQIYSLNKDVDIAYAYHLDAGLLAEYLKNYCKNKGVKQILDKVVDITLDEQGFICHLRTEYSGDLSGDLFIDCSGFKGLLINQALEEPFISYADSLLCDSAIAISVPYDEQDTYELNSGGIEPFTTSTALSSGWTWKTPLVGRSGNGYVYSQNFISAEEAEAEFRQHLGNKAKHSPSKHIKMRVGKTRNSWVKNCISIGLSSGFIEPLESTGIFLIEMALENLKRYFPDKNFDQKTIENFNRVINNYYEEISDFIIMHYYLTNREDSKFWRANKYNSFIPETLKKKLELWKNNLPQNNEKEFIQQLFPDFSYLCILDGLNCLPKDPSNLLNSNQDNDYWSNRMNEISKSVEFYIDHSEYIKNQIDKNQINYKLPELARK